MGADVASVEPHDAKAVEGDGPSTARIVLALAAGCLLASLGASLAVSGFLHGVAWWQCWPLALVSTLLAGAIPDKIVVRY